MFRFRIGEHGGNFGEAFYRFDRAFATSSRLIVFSKAKQLIVPADADGDKIKELFDAFVAENGYKPKVAFVADLGMFTCGATIKEAVTAQTVMLDAIKVVAYAESFGGVSPMPQFLIDFIVNWEVESYRSKVSLAGGAAKRKRRKSM